MPMKPKPGETQSEFTSRCVPEMMGDGKREQDQAVAACLQIWRDKDKKNLKASTPEPDDDESQEEFFDRCANELYDTDPDMDDVEVEDRCQLAWEESRAARAGQRKGHDPVLHKTHSSTVSDFEFILSDDSVDRMGDTIASDGWDITNFKRNPIALWNHSPSAPIGKWANLRVENGSLRGHLQFAPKGISPRIDEIRALVEAGILQAVSVGFRPLDSEPINPKDPWGGQRFKKQELIETSLVSVPANANALAIAKALKISPATLDIVFLAKHGNRDRVTRRDFTAKQGKTSHDKREGKTMSLAQRIIDLQTWIANKKAELDASVSKMDDTNVSDADLEKNTLLNAQIKQATAQLAVLEETEKNIAATAVADDTNNGGDHRRRSLVATTSFNQDHRDLGIGAPLIIKHSKKDWEPLDYLTHAGVISAYAKIHNMLPDQARLKIYGDDEPTKVVFDWTQRAASAPAMTTVTGWAAELVQQVYSDMMALLMPKSVFPRLSAKGLNLNFGRAGKIILPTRSRTPTIAGSFVGEGMAIPVRQGAFTAQTFIPKKMAVITTWTREMDDHSIPAIEGVLRDAIQEDTAVALDSVLLDANPATTIRPAGILNGVAPITATAITNGAVAALVGDMKNLIGALVASTYGNIRNPTWLMNPADMLSVSLINAPNTGIFPWRDEIGRGTLNNIPVIDSATVPVKTMILIDAADFVTMGGDNIRFEMSDQATLHMEDTTPLDLVSGSPGTVASPQRSLFQTDSLALRMIFPLNWSIRRGGTVSWTQSVTW